MWLWTQLLLTTLSFRNHWKCETTKNTWDWRGTCLRIFKFCDFSFILFTNREGLLLKKTSSDPTRFACTLLNSKFKTSKIFFFKIYILRLILFKIIMAMESATIIITPGNLQSNEHQSIDIRTLSKEISEKSLSCMCFKFVLAGLFILTSIQVIYHHLRWGGDTPANNNTASREWWEFLWCLSEHSKMEKDFDKKEKRIILDSKNEQLWQRNGWTLISLDVATKNEITSKIWSKIRSEI